MVNETENNKHCLLQKTDLYDYRFIGCKFHNSSFKHTHEGCGVDFLLDHHLTDVFKENLFTQFAIIPGNIFSSLILDRVGRVKTMGEDGYYFPILLKISYKRLINDRKKCAF